MVAGLPGAGLGGLYYLGSILVMWAREAIRFVTGKRNRAKSAIARETVLILAGVLVSLWLNGLAVQFLVWVLWTRWHGGAAGTKALPHAGLPLNALAISAAILGGLLLSVQLLRLLVRRPVREARRSLG